MSEEIHKYAMWQQNAEDPYNLTTPAALPSDETLLTFAAAHYESADLGQPDRIVLHIVLPRDAGVTSNLRQTLARALAGASRRDR